MTSASFDRMWAQLEPIGRDAATGGYRRFAWTRTDHTLREWFTDACVARGLTLTEDRAGNQWAWWGDPDGHRQRTGEGGIVIGSHLDSVPDGGAFDGPLGVVSALAVIDALRERGVQPQRPIAVVNFVDEEGARFGVACAGSRIITGALTPDRALALQDGDGVTMAEAWHRAARDPASMGPDRQTVDRIGVFVELHVEQGRALALTPDGQVDLTLPDRAVAIGTDIWPHGRWRLDLPGRADHAGTTRLQDRDDALLKLAEVVQTARAEANRHSCVSTVGKVLVEPGGVNAIPSHVRAWLDARGAKDTRVRELVNGIEQVVAGHGGSVTEESWTPTTTFDAAVLAALQATLPHAPLLGTAAGHDAGILANAGVPVAMLFVRNPTGTSHAPDEYAEQRDCHAGATALTDVVTDLVVGEPVGTKQTQGTRRSG